MAKRQWAGLTDIDLVSGTAEDGPGEFRGFVAIRATAVDGSHMAGQLDPATVRKMALNFLGVAEAAEQDAVVMNMLVRDVGLESAVAANFIMHMREERHRIHPDEDDR
jgi:hypothetical protein